MRWSVLSLVACGQSGEPPPDIVTLCADRWDARPCGGDATYCDVDNAPWIEGYLDYVALRHGVSRELVDQRLTVLHVLDTGYPIHHGTVAVQYEVGWAAAVYEIDLTVDEPEPRAQDVLDALIADDTKVPRVSPEIRAADWETIAAFRTDCGRRHHSALDDEWCAGDVGLDGHITVDQDGGVVRTLPGSTGQDQLFARFGTTNSGERRCFVSWIGY